MAVMAQWVQQGHLQGHCLEVHLLPPEWVQVQTVDDLSLVALVCEHQSRTMGQWQGDQVTQLGWISSGQTVQDSGAHQTGQNHFGQASWFEGSRKANL